MFAREISVGGCLFVLFALALFILFNIPFQNLLGKFFKGRKNILALIEICLCIIAALVLTRMVEPVVSEWIHRMMVTLADLIFSD